MTLRLGYYGRGGLWVHVGGALSPSRAPASHAEHFFLIIADTAAAESESNEAQPEESIHSRQHESP